MQRSPTRLETIHPPSRKSAANCPASGELFIPPPGINHENPSESYSCNPRIVT